MSKLEYCCLTRKLFSNGTEKITIKNQSINFNGVKKHTHAIDIETGEVFKIVNKHTMESAIESSRRARQMLLDLVENNTFNYFVTLTFSPEEVEDRLNDEETKFAFQMWRKSIRRRLPNMYYIAVPEYHKKGGLHFHLLVGGVDSEDLKLTSTDKVCCSWLPKKACTFEYYEKHKKGKQLKPTDGLLIFKVNAWKKGFSNATVIVNSDAAKYYVTKYISKGTIDSRFLHKKRFYCSQNIVRPYVEKIKSPIISGEKLENGFIVTPDLLKKFDLNNFEVNYLDNDKQYIALKRKTQSGIIENEFRNYDINLYDKVFNEKVEEIKRKKVITKEPRVKLSELDYKLIQVDDYNLDDIF